MEFPDALRVEDAPVNAFVERAMAECASGDYERFRLLWSAKEEPLPRGEYEQGWQAVRKIAVRALDKVILANDTEAGSAPNRLVYVLLVEVSLDPNHRAGRKEPLREVVLMLVEEQDQWRLATPPKNVRNWIKARTAETDSKASLTEPLPDVPDRGNSP